MIRGESISTTAAKQPSSTAVQLLDTGKPYSISSVENVHSLMDMPVADIACEEIQTALERGAERFLDLEAHDALPKVMQQLLHVVHELRVPADGDNPVYVFITDDLFPDTMARHEPDATYIGVSLGMLNFAQNDAELKFAIGHQLEKPNSQVRDRRVKVFGSDESVKQKNELTVVETVIWHSLQGAEENEVDIRSVVNRLVNKGENPYVAEDFVLRMEEQLDGTKREGHNAKASDSTRRQAIGMAIAALRRGMGKFALVSGIIFSKET